MRVPQPPHPRSLTEKEFLELLQLLKYATGDNYFQVADDLQVTRPTLYRWSSRAGPPPKRRFYSLIFKDLLTRYLHLHQDLITSGSSPRIRSYSEHAVRKIQTSPAFIALSAVTPTSTIIDEADDPIYTLHITWEDGTTDFSSDLTFNQANRQAANSAFSAKKLFITLNGKTEKLDIWRRTKFNQDQDFPGFTLPQPDQESDSDD